MMCCEDNHMIKYPTFQIKERIWWLCRETVKSKLVNLGYLYTYICFLAWLSSPQSRSPLCLLYFTKSKKADRDGRGALNDESWSMMKRNEERGTGEGKEGRRDGSYQESWTSLYTAFNHINGEHFHYLITVVIIYIRVLTSTRIIIWSCSLSCTHALAHFICLHPTSFLSLVWVFFFPLSSGTFVSLSFTFCPFSSLCHNLCFPISPSLSHLSCL